MSDDPASHETNEDNWLPVSDLMAGLMITFLFIAIILISGAVQEVTQDNQKRESSICDEIQQSLQTVAWKEQIDICEGGIVIKFKNPELLFGVGESSLKPGFQAMLEEFFPKYMDIIWKYRDDIEEIRIEGHTDQTGQADTPLGRYDYNMGLSQARTRAVMKFLFQTEAAQVREDWLIRHTTAVGMSSSRPVLRDDGSIDEAQSRRVEFKIRLKPSQRLRELDAATSLS